jgi:hypothetical protein
LGSLTNGGSRTDNKGVDNVPDRLEPYITQQEPNEPIVVATGPFKLREGNLKANLAADLVFRWQPESDVRFEGDMSVGSLTMPWGSEKKWRLEGTSVTGPFSADVIFTNLNPGATASHVRGVTRK